MVRPDSESCSDEDAELISTPDDGERLPFSLRIPLLSWGERLAGLSDDAGLAVVC